MDLSHITGNCRIGSNVFISVLVATANDNLVIGRRYREDDAIGPTIEDDATIGAGAVILPRVRIGRGAFVAAGSVVTRDVERLTLVMGSPARFVRKLKSGSAS
jgi:acetyltransferase-like isoleucine patch superfamily enzyme